MSHVAAQQPLIRPAVSADVKRILELCVLHAAFEQSPLPALTDDSRMERERALDALFFGPHPRCRAWLCKSGKR